MRNYYEVDAMQRGRTIIYMYATASTPKPSLLPGVVPRFKLFHLISTNRITAAGSRSALLREGLQQGGACTNE